MRSVATSSSVSPRSKMSRTLPHLSGARPLSVVWMRGGWSSTGNGPRSEPASYRLDLRLATVRNRSAGTADRPDILCGSHATPCAVLRGVHDDPMKTRFALTLLLAFALVAWLLRSVDLMTVWTHVREADRLSMLAGLGFLVITYVARAIRWQYLLAPVGPTRFRTAFRTTIIGF